MLEASLKPRQIATKERERAGRLWRPRRGSDRALKLLAIGVLISMALTGTAGLAAPLRLRTSLTRSALCPLSGGAQSASSRGSNVTRSCMDKSYELSNGCKGSSILIQGCFADMIELSECTEQVIVTKLWVCWVVLVFVRWVVRSIVATSGVVWGPGCTHFVDHVVSWARRSKTPSAGIFVIRHMTRCTLCVPCASHCRFLLAEQLTDTQSAAL